MGKIIEGLWDCPYCEQKGIGGLTKTCPNCAHPQDEGTVFYLGDQKKVLDQDTAKNYGQGADWICPYCDSLNRHNASECVNCGAVHEASSVDYKQQRAKEAMKKIANPPVQERTAEEDERRIEQIAEHKSKRLKVLLIIAAIIAFIVILSMPKKKDFTLSDKSWSREIKVEEMQTVKESDWREPTGARCYDEKEEVKEYEEVIDHYEDVRVEKTREVQDGYDEEVEYIDNGDGTFSESVVSTPRYVTETYYEYESQPVYVSVPVYATKHYYEIDKWIEVRSVTSDGKDNEPTWGDVTLGENEREGNRIETYMVTFINKKGKKEYTAEVSQDMWNSLKIGDKKEVTVKGSKIIAIDGKNVK